MEKVQNDENSSKKNVILKGGIRNNKPLFLASILMLIYSIVEIADCIAFPLLLLNVIPNVYLDFEFSIPIMQSILQDNPIYLLPLMIGATLMRVIATIGLFKNRLWGFWIAVLSLISTMGLAILFIPFGFFELFLSIIILMPLIIGYCGNKPVV